LLAGLPSTGAVGLTEHLARYGRFWVRSNTLNDVGWSGLTGCGGARYPTAAKMSAVLKIGKPAVVVGNGCEGEPASHKDRLLLTAVPHLVLDGLAAAAALVRATQAHLVVPGRSAAWAAVSDALRERRQAGLDPVSVQLHAAPKGYTASQDSALCQWLSGGPAKPRTVPPYPAVRGVARRPTLVQNAETLAHLALIVRYGPDWFRELGTEHAPGTALVTVGGAVPQPNVYEVEFGTPLTEVIAGAGGQVRPTQAVLTGGYLGGWLAADAVSRLTCTPPDLSRAGGSLGAGVLFVLPDGACGLAETARVLRYMAGETAGQCGPCVHGLPALADAFSYLAAHGRDPRMRMRVEYLAEIVAGRGACHHPDGSANLALSALRVFAGDVRQHETRGPCDASGHPGVLPLPADPASKRR
jgi:NADH:ubiquinone oxidoreductase subunit F (NADH-binding)